jgi:hypothetical protein
VNRPRGKSNSATAATAMEKPLGGKVQNQTFPPSLQIAQKTHDSHFPTAATTAGLGLHSPCLDGRPQGYILKWLDAARIRKFHSSASLPGEPTQDPAILLMKVTAGSL